jgi:hypothetical protein
MNHLVTIITSIEVDDNVDDDDDHIGRSLLPDDERDSRSHALQNAPVPSKITVFQG